MNRLEKILKLRFENKLSLKEIGYKFGLTPQRIQQIISRERSSTYIIKPNSPIEHQCPICFKKYLRNKLVNSSACSKYCLSILEYCENLMKRNKCFYCGINKNLYINNERISKINGLLFIQTYCTKCNTKRVKKWRNKGNKQKKILLEIRRRNDKKFPEKVRARWILNEALQRGEVIKPLNCLKCGENKKLDAHHPDYSKPLEVIWYCRTCHILIHRPKKLLTLQSPIKV